MTTTIPFKRDEMVALAGSAIAKIDKYGRRGTTLLSLDETEAVVCCLACFDLGDLPAPFRDPDDPDKEPENDQ